MVSDSGGRPSVSGIVYGNKVTEYLAHSHTEIETDGTVERERVSRIYHFGLASSLREFGETKESFEVPRHLYAYPIDVIG